MHTAHKPHQKQQQVQVRAASAPIGESPRKAQMNATMQRVRRCLEEEARDGEGEDAMGRGVPPVTADPPVKSARKGGSAEKNAGSGWSRRRQHRLRNAHEASQEMLDSASFIDHGVAGFGSMESVHIGESSSSVLWDNAGAGDEFNVSNYLSSQPQSPIKDLQVSKDGSLSEQKDAWFRYHDDPPHSSVAPSINRIRNVSPPQVRPEKKAVSAHGKLTGQGLGVGMGMGSMDDADAEDENFLYKGEWSMSTSIAKAELGTTLDAKSSLLEISGSGVLIS
jgi:hypothetical protein